jgi:hypothetical protein
MIQPPTAQRNELWPYATSSGVWLGLLLLVCLGWPQENTYKDEHNEYWQFYSLGRYEELQKPQHQWQDY